MIAKHLERAYTAWVAARHAWRAEPDKLVLHFDDEPTTEHVAAIGYNDDDIGTDVDAPVDLCAETELPAEKGWMQTFTGRKFYPLDPRVEDIVVLDVAHGLSMACRYGGHSSRFYSVAEHCVLVSLYVQRAATAAGKSRDEIRELSLEALLHDSAEAYIGDMIRPLKHQPEMVQFRCAEAAIEAAVYAAFQIMSTPESHALIKDIDDRIIVDEIRALMHTPDMYREWITGRVALGAPITGYPPKEAKLEFLRRFEELAR